MIKKMNLLKIKKEFQSFFVAVTKGNEKIYLLLLSLYIAVYAILKIAWIGSLENPTDYLRGLMLGFIMWGSVIYLFFVIVDWKNLWNRTSLLILVAVILLALTFWFSKIMTTNSHGVVMDIFFCVMACGKGYRKILRCIAGVASACLIVAGIGVVFGYTIDVPKPENIHPGHSFGIVYPNTWGFLCFLVLMIVWYLYLRKSNLLCNVLTFLLFWGTAAFMYIIVCCRTIALLTICFPILAMIVNYLEYRADHRTLMIDTSTSERSSIRYLISGLIIIIPFIMLVVMLTLSLNLEWMHSKFYNTPFHTMAMRFVIGGLFLRQYGFVLFGNPFRGNVLQVVNVNEEYINVDILDSSFVAFLIMRGAVWMVYTLIWLCLAHWKGLKKRDFAIPFLSSIILVFAMMERPGLEMWYNFILLYPLAKVISKPGTKPVLEFDSKFCDGVIKAEDEFDYLTELFDNEDGVLM